MKRFALIAVLAALLAAVAQAAPKRAAAPQAVVEGVQMPAWVERARGGARIPLAPGMELRRRRRGADRRRLAPALSSSPTAAR